MNKKTKTRVGMFALSLAFFVLGSAILSASSSTDTITVTAVLKDAIQDIQRIYFSSGAIKPDNPEDEVGIYLQSGVINISGSVLMGRGYSGYSGVLGSGSSIFFGTGNVVRGKDSYIVAGTHNSIGEGVDGNSIILGGEYNVITGGYNNYILGGGHNTIRTGNSNFILGATNSQIKNGNNSYVLFGNNVIISGSDSVAAGKNIKIDHDRSFVFSWRNQETKPSKDGTFIVYATGGMNIWGDGDSTSHAIKEFMAPGAVSVKGAIQMADEAVTCGVDVQGAIQYTGGQNGCFCGCNGSGRVSLVPNQKCQTLCPAIVGSSS